MTPNLVSPQTRARWRPSASKVLSPTDLAARLFAERTKNLLTKMVFTNGCFDLLHSGHVDYLERARNLGSLLIVALNGDQSIKRLKGDARPVNPLKDRMRVLASLECVDWVTWFHTETPLQLILKLRPDVLVKGGDWRHKKIVGSKEVKTWGGEVRTLSFLKGKSTTGLIERITGHWVKRT